MNDFFDDFSGLDWQDWMIFAPLSEDIAHEELEIEKARRDTLGENDAFADDETFDMDFDFDPEGD